MEQLNMIHETVSRIKNVITFLKRSDLSEKTCDQPEIFNFIMTVQEKWVVTHCQYKKIFIDISDNELCDLFHSSEITLYNTYNYPTPSQINSAGDMSIKSFVTFISMYAVQPKINTKLTLSLQCVMAKVARFKSSNKSHLDHDLNE